MRPPGMREKVWPCLVVGPNRSCDPEDVSVSQLQPRLFFTKSHQNAAVARLYSSKKLIRAFQTLQASLSTSCCQSSVWGWPLSWFVHQREPLSHRPALPSCSHPSPRPALRLEFIANNLSSYSPSSSLPFSGLA